MIWTGWTRWRTAGWTARRRKRSWSIWPDAPSAGHIMRVPWRRTGVLADTGINPPADFAAGVMERIRPRRQVQWPRMAAGLAACLLLAAGATLALPQAVPEPPSFYREYPELLSSEDQTLVFTLGTKGTDVFEEETRKETEMRYRQLPGESVPVVEDAGLCRRTAAALARQGIAPDDGGVYRLTPRQMETMYIQAPELALVHMGSVFLLDSLG